MTRADNARDGSPRAPLTRDRVLEALAEIADPEIPVVSIVDLGVVKDVRLAAEPADDARVEVDFTPTFMGCPALDVMRAQIEAAIRGLGAEPDVHVLLDDSWSTDRISPEGRERLRTAGFAPPAPRSAGRPSLVQLERGPFPCPWCGSTDTRLDNVFGPTPCRSLRYCNACRQPFEQFKTI